MSQAFSHCIVPSCPPSQEGRDGCCSSGGLLDAQPPGNQAFPPESAHAQGLLWFLAPGHLLGPFSPGESLLPPLRFFPGSGVGSLLGAFISILKKPLGT